MAGLPAPPSPTLNAIWASYEATQDDGYREHLGASLIGASCDRAIWYSFRWTTRARFSGRMLRLFETGNLAEARFVANLRATGATVLDIDDSTGRQWVLRDDSGHFGGSMDGCAIGILESPKTWHVTEFKTHSAKSFASLVKDGVQKAKPQHYAQMQAYMHLTGMTRALYMAVNKDNDDMHVERIHYDATAALRLMARASFVVNSASPPSRISEDASWFQCRFCDHADACHGGRLPDAHCRSCLHSSPVEGGKWTCELTGEYLDRAAQIEGCGRHLYIPGLVPGEQIDADPAIGWVSYRMRDGSTFTDGVPF